MGVNVSAYVAGEKKLHEFNSAVDSSAAARSAAA